MLETAQEVVSLSDCTVLVPEHAKRVKKRWCDQLTTELRDASGEIRQATAESALCAVLSSNAYETF